MADVNITMRITEELKLGLEKLAELEDRPLSNYLRKALREHLELHTKGEKSPLVRASLTLQQP